MPVVSGTADPGQRAHPFDPNAIALLLNRRVDHRVDGVSPGSPCFRRCSLTCRKAARKKSRSSCCWPIFRSRSAIRPCSPPGAGADDEADNSSTGRAIFNGRPIACKASAPPDRYFRRQMYSNSRRTPSSSARPVTFTTSSIRARARSLNSRVHRVRVVPVVQGRVLLLVRGWVFNTLVLLVEQCVLFPCLSSGVHSCGVREE